MSSRFNFDFDTIPGDGPLTEEDLAEHERTLDPDSMIAEHTARQTRATEILNEKKLRRLMEENQALSGQLASTQETQAALVEEQAYMRGRLESLGNTQQLPDELATTEEEEALHGHATPYISKVAKREMLQMKAEMEQAHQAQLAAIEAKFSNELAVRDQNLEQLGGTLRSNFEDEVDSAARQLGLNIHMLKADDDFARFAARPLAVGSSKTWGEQLEQNIAQQELGNTIGMLRQYAKHSKVAPVSEDNLEVPASTGARPMTAQGRQNLENRMKLIQKAEALTDDFIGGRYNGTQEEYQKEKAALLNKADDISINV